MIDLVVWVILGGAVGTTVVVTAAFGDQLVNGLSDIAAFYRNVLRRKNS